MTQSNRLLSAVLLLLIGVLIGIIVMVVRQDPAAPDLAEVRYTEVNRSETPAFTSDELESIDDRFLFRTVARSVTPTVVYVETDVPSDERTMSGMEQGDEDSSIWQQFMPPKVRTVGSGVLISNDGYILTNNHVVEDAIRDGITVTLEDKRTYNSRIVGTDPSTDLAVLKIDDVNLPHATIGNSDSIEVGEWVMAIGNPFRLQSTVTAGIVSALGREVDIINDFRRIESFIQTDAAINRGNSGGALVNTSGELIGINTAIASQSGGYQGYGFAVPSNLAMKVARDIIEFGRVRRGMLGIQIRTVDADMVDNIGLDSIRGVYVTDVVREGAAEEAGMQPSDIILEVNNEQVNAANQLQEKVAMFRPGDTITLSVWRSGDMVDVQATLSELERPEPETEALSFGDEPQIEPEDNLFNNPEDDNTGIKLYSNEAFGVGIRGLSSPEDPDLYDFYIEEIRPDSPAFRRGVPEGAKIMTINGVDITTLEQINKLFEEAMQHQSPIELKILTESGTIGYYNLSP